MWIPFFSFLSSLFLLFRNVAWLALGWSESLQWNLEPSFFFLSAHQVRYLNRRVSRTTKPVDKTLLCLLWCDSGVFAISPCHRTIDGLSRLAYELGGGGDDRGQLIFQFLFQSKTELLKCDKHAHSLTTCVSSCLSELVLSGVAATQNKNVACPLLVIAWWKCTCESTCSIDSLTNWLAWDDTSGFKDTHFMWWGQFMQVTFTEKVWGSKGDAKSHLGIFTFWNYDQTSRTTRANLSRCFWQVPAGTVGFCIKLLCNSLKLKLP